MTKLITGFVGFTTVLALSASALVFPALATNGTQTWDTSGDYVVAMEYQDTDYPHNMTLNQAANGDLTGYGGSPAGNNTYLWTITDGSVTNNVIEFTAEYTETEDAVVPQTTIYVTGMIAENGTMSGNWSDNYSGDDRSGTWSTTQGTASTMPTETEESADQNNDGFIDTVEGIPFYGAIVESLTTSGDTSPDSGLALDRFPVANNQGSYLYERTFTLDEDTDLDDIAVVIHSHDTNENGVYDGEKRSTVDPSFPFEATIPVACGVLEKKVDGSYKAYLTELNSSGVTGYSIVNMVDGQAEVYNKVYGVTPNLAHLQHFHQGGDNTCPPNTVGVTMDDDSFDGDMTEGDLSGEVVADYGVLEVTSIEMVDTTATANGSFTDGWEYVFHITAPTNEPKLAMKFADWMQTNGNDSIPVANNMRISSLQANNSGATILLTAENVYSTPDLYMVTDLDPTMDGIQVEITVEVAVPNGTQNGAYTTSYGLRSNQ